MIPITNWMARNSRAAAESIWLKYPKITSIEEKMVATASKVATGVDAYGNNDQCGHGICLRRGALVGDCNPPAVTGLPLGRWYRRNQVILHIKAASCAGAALVLSLVVGGCATSAKSPATRPLPSVAPTTGPAATTSAALLANVAKPGGVAVAPDGSVYFTDYGNERVRKITAGAITTVAGDGMVGSGGDGGPATAAELNDPYAVAVAADGSVYVADSGNNRVRRISPAGVITTLAGDGQAGFGGDNGQASKAELDRPYGVAVAGDGSVYIADFGNNRVRRVSPSGVITTFAGDSKDGYTGDGGPATSAELSEPFGVAVAADGTVYIADSGNSVIRRVSPLGVITTVAGNGQDGYSGDNGPATSAELGYPEGVAVAADGSFDIADDGNQDIRRVNSSGVITTVAGNGQTGYRGDNGPATAAALSDPTGVAVGRDGSIYIADHNNNRVRRVSPSGIITTFAGDGEGGFSGDNGPATAAELTSPNGVAVGRDGSIYIADRGNNRIRRVNPSGIITTVAGDGLQGFGGDKGPATSAELDSPTDVVVGGDGSVYIADYGNNRIRRVTPKGVITTVAGNGEDGSSGDNGQATAAALSDPVGVAVASDGTIYIADYGNDQVRRVSPTGVITTIAGNGEDGSSGDNGPATSAELSEPSGVAVGGDGSVYIADSGNNEVRKVSTAGIITTVAGDGQNGFRGDNGPATSAELSEPTAVAVAGDGSLYIADYTNARIRRVNPRGIITTVAGGASDLIGDNGPATAADLSGPNGVAVASDGTIYIADTDNDRVRRVSLSGIITTVAGISGRP